jgi:hypothetical protein
MVDFFSRDESWRHDHQGWLPADSRRSSAGNDRNLWIPLKNSAVLRLRSAEGVFLIFGAIFCSWTKAKRKRHFLNLLASFDPMYESIHALRVRNGEIGLLSPGELEKWANAEWSDPHW